MPLYTFFNKSKVSKEEYKDYVQTRLNKPWVRSTEIRDNFLKKKIYYIISNYR